MNHLEALASAAQAAAVHFHGVNIHWDGREARFIERAFNDTKALMQQVLPSPAQKDNPKEGGIADIMALRHAHRRADNMERIIAEVWEILGPDTRALNIVDGVRILAREKEQAEARVKVLEDERDERDGWSTRSTDLFADLKKVKARLAAIDAAKAGEPKGPSVNVGGMKDFQIGHIEELRSWGRQGWDAAAALRVERDEAIATANGAKRDRAVVVNNMAFIENEAQRQQDVRDATISRLTRERDNLAAQKVSDRAVGAQGAARRERERIITIMAKGFPFYAETKEGKTKLWMTVRDGCDGFALNPEILRRALETEKEPSNG